LPLNVIWGTYLPYNNNWTGENKNPKNQKAFPFHLKARINTKPKKKKKVFISDLQFFFLWDRVSLCSPGCPGTHFVDQAGLELRNPPASASRVLGLKACATMPGPTSNFITWKLKTFLLSLGKYLFTYHLLNLKQHDGLQLYNKFHNVEAYFQKSELIYMLILRCLTY
jgi:hypothetical protein